MRGIETGNLYMYAQIYVYISKMEVGLPYMKRHTWTVVFTDLGLFFDDRLCLFYFLCSKKCMCISLGRW